MLRDYLDQICKELEVERPKLNEEKWYPFQLREDLQINLKDLDPGVAMTGVVCDAPQKKREEVYIYLMRANLLGQGTGGARIGMDETEKSLTLSLGLPYELDYSAFRESLEDFANYLVFWREEMTKIETEKSIL
jgi:hypothetical protein